MRTRCDASFELYQPYAVRDWAAPFLFSEEIWKRALILYRVFRKLSFLNLPGFLWCEAIRIPAFFIFKKGAGSQRPIISRSSLSGKGGFFRFRSKLPASEKRAPENMEVKSEKSNEFQTYENRPGIPWPYRALSKLANESCLFFRGFADVDSSKYLHLKCFWG